MLGPTVDKGLFLSLDDIKQEHKRRHHPASVSDCVNLQVWILFTYSYQYFQMNIKGSVRFSLVGSTVVENTVIESQTSVTVDLKWNHVETILETPPLSSSAILVIAQKAHNPVQNVWSSFFVVFVYMQNIKVSSGDTNSPLCQMYRELVFLQVCISHLTWVTLHE